MRSKKMRSKEQLKSTRFDGVRLKKRLKTVRAKLENVRLGNVRTRLRNVRFGIVKIENMRLKT